MSHDARRLPPALARAAACEIALKPSAADTRPEKTISMVWLPASTRIWYTVYLASKDAIAGNSWHSGIRPIPDG
jgi:hypothetical protein